MPLVVDRAMDEDLVPDPARVVAVVAVANAQGLDGRFVLLEAPQGPRVHLAERDELLRLSAEAGLARAGPCGARLDLNAPAGWSTEHRRSTHDVRVAPEAVVAAAAALLLAHWEGLTWIGKVVVFTHPDFWKICWRKFLRVRAKFIRNG